MTRLLSIDIGSTYTKGGLFELSDGAYRLVSYARTPTTVDHLKRGFDTVRSRLDPSLSMPVAFSSSARGGLAIAAIGLVPELTLKIARQAALSAGGRVASVHAYKLLQEEVTALAQVRPDILLLAGGTDGGNETYIRHNANLLVQLPTLLSQEELPSVIYAGNAAARTEVARQLREAGFDVSEAANLMPHMDQVAADEARACIRDVFLRKIIHGKGLDAIVSDVGHVPQPTPLAMLELSQALRDEGFGDFLLIDMGGATTDVYSAGENLEQDLRVLLRGVREPEVQRTVEGDLGMRVSASVAAASASGYLRRMLGESHHAAFAAYMEHLTAVPDHLPERGSQEAHFDRILASACIHHALLRHAGTWQRVFTTEGETFLQHGKDLRHVRTLVGSGGYLSAMADFAPSEAGLPSGSARSEIRHLIPDQVTYYRDADYVWPLLGNLVAHGRGPAARGAIASLRIEGACALNPSPMHA